MGKPKTRAQGGFEYVLLVAGILLVVVSVVFVTRGGVIQPAGRDIALAECRRQLALAGGCYDGSAFDPTKSTEELASSQILALITKKGTTKMF